MTAREAKRALTPDGFGRFLRWLSDDDELAVLEYQTIRRKLVRYFVHKGCSDPDELFDQTVDIVIRKIEVCAEYPSPLAYCYGVARNVWHEDTRERKSVPLEVDVASPEHQDPNAYELELQCLDRCLARLSPGDRDVVTRYHSQHGRDKIPVRRGLADGAGGMNALRIRVCRIRKELRICVVECTKRLLN